MKVGHVFLFSLAASLAFQAWLWSGGDYTDSGIWEPQATLMAARGIPPVTSTLLGFPVPLVLYPGVPILLPTTALVAHGVDADTAMRVLMPILISIFVAGSAAVCAALAPGSAWWVATLVLLGFSSLYLNATPPSAVSMALIPFLVLQTLYAKRVRSISSFVLLGIIGGIGLSTRFDITAAVLGFSLAYLAWFRFKPALYAGILSILLFFVIDPYMHTHPLALFSRMISTIGTVYSTSRSPFSLLSLVQAIPFALIGILLVIGNRMVPGIRATLQKGELIWILSLSAVIIALLLYSGYHPNWYFYPLLTVWEVFGALSLIDLVRSVPSSSFLYVPEKLQPACVVGSLALIQLIVYVHPFLF